MQIEDQGVVAPNVVAPNVVAPKLRAMNEQQVAQLLLGFARAQRAVVRGLTQGDADRMRNVVAALQGEAGIGRREAQPTLTDLPSRVLLQVVGGMPTGQQERLDAWIQQELARLLR